MCLVRGCTSTVGERIIVPAVHEATKATTARYTAEQLKLKAGRDLQRIEVEARQEVVSAKAEAESPALNGLLAQPLIPPPSLPAPPTAHTPLQAL